MELPPDVAAEVAALCAEADGAAQSGSLAPAAARYQAALDLLPEPRGQWRVAIRLWASLGEVLYRGHDHAGALEMIALAMDAGAGSVPRLHLRRGQCLLALGHRDAALDALVRAHVGGGSALFAGEDPALLALVRAELPPRPGEEDP